MLKKPNNLLDLLTTTNSLLKDMQTLYIHSLYYLRSLKNLNRAQNAK
jgi:hypothetical protein